MSAPIYGCSGCATTSGRMGCPYHGATAIGSIQFSPFSGTNDPPPPRRMTPLLTARQVAKLLGVHVNSIKRMVRDNEIAHYRLGTRGDLRFRESDVEAWLEGRRA